MELFSKFSEVDHLDNHKSPIDELPEIIEEHPFHPKHTIRLQKFGYKSKNYYCHSCHKIISHKKTNHDPTYYYKCDSCNFNMDVDCALMEPTTIDSGKSHIQHFSHQHPLVVINADSTNDAKYCFGCHQSLWKLGVHDEKAAYGCPECDYFLHKSCAELPQEIKKHPLHPSHPLFLQADHYLRCKNCHNSNRFIYNCEQEKGCQLAFSRMCINCGLPPKMIKYRGHKHLLRLFTEINADHLSCKAHYSYCKQSVTSDDLNKGIESYWFSCVLCDFHIHLLCGPLPCTIKSSFHRHPLHLVDTVVDEDEVDAEYYCDVCEFTRDPGICVYYCADCKFVAHVRCVITEVVEALQQNLEYVGLRTIRGSNLALEMEQKEGTEDENHHITMKKTEELETENAALSLNYIIKKLIPKEQKILKRDFYWDSTSTTKNHDIEHNHDIEQHEAIVRESSVRVINAEKELFDDYSQKAFLYSDDKFMEFVHKLHFSFDKSIIESRFLTQKMLRVKDYMVPKELGGVLSSLLDKHGDISNGLEESSLEMKNLCFCLLCQVIEGLLISRVKGITESLLQDWYRKVKFVRNRGFQIEFLVANLEQVMLAYFGKKVKESDAENVMTKLDQIDAKILRLLSDVVLLKAEKKKHKEYFDKFGPYETSVNSLFLEKCKNKACEFNWKTVGDSLF